MRLLLFISSLFLLVGLQYDGNPTKDVIYWSADVLTWDDFQGRPQRNLGYEAMTHSEIGLEMDVIDNQIKVNIPVKFSRLKSWTKSDTSAALLKHEQVHFDIAEVVGRKIRQDLSSYKARSVRAGYSHIQQVYKKHIQTTWGKYDAYDRESDHGIKMEKQKEWEQKIAKELKELDRYSETTVFIPIEN